MNKSKTTNSDSVNAIVLKFTDNKGFNCVGVRQHHLQKEFHPHWPAQISLQEEPCHHQEASRQKDRDKSMPSPKMTDN